MIKTKKQESKVVNMRIDENEVYQNKIDIAVIKKDIETIKTNHLFHIEKDVAKLHEKVEKIDTRIWAVLGILIVSVLAPLIAQLFN